MDKSVETLLHTRILVVDDNPDIVESMTLLLELEGYQVQGADDGQTALALATSFHPHIVLLDIGLPGTNGYEIARRLRQNPGAQQARLIAMTGYNLTADSKSGSHAEFDHYLAKPVDIEVLNALIRAG